MGYQILQRPHRMSRHEIESTLEVPAGPSLMWERCYADPAAWPEWNRELASARLEGPFEVGTVAHVRFKTGLRLRFRLVEVDPPKVFTDEARLPGARMGHRHVLESTPTGTRMRNTIYFAGPLAALWARFMDKRAAAALEQGQRRMAEMVAKS
jgi:Polyketide cyclase / dehydrase and lipid transport